MKSAEIDISKIGQPYIANVIGYKERHNRILSSHWLAKNFPVNELLTNWKNNNSLDKTYNIIKNSKYSSKSHLQQNKFLRENYYEDNFDAQTPWNIWHPSYKRFITHLLPHIFRKSLVSILLDTANLEPINTLSDKSLYSMASGCLILPVGCYQIHEMLKKIGFCIFDDVFDMKHLENKDLYARTVMGFENNKSIITSKEKVKHLWNEHSREIQHNHIHACKTDSIKNFFKESIGLAKEACKFVDGSTDYELGFGVY